MIDHITVLVRNYESSKRFFLAALKPLGYELIIEFDGKQGGFGVDGKPDFWLGEGAQNHRMHIAFRAADRQTVRNFYRIAIESGGTDNGEPGVRPHYHLNYYGAFVIDPDGNNIEAVCHTGESV